MSNRVIFKKVLNDIGAYQYYLFLSVLLAAVSVVLTLYVPILIGNAIDCLIGANQVHFDALMKILFKIIFVVLATALLQWLMNICNNRITYHVVRDMRKKVFEKIETLPCSYLDSHSNGDIVSRVITDVDQFADGLLLGFTQFFTGIVTIIGTLAYMLSINIWITLVVVVLTPVSFLIARFVAKNSYFMFKKQSETRGEQTAFIDEMISNQKVAEAYGMNDRNLERFGEINDRLTDYSLKAIFFSSITNPGTRFVNSIVYAAVALFGAVMAVKGSITVGILTCFLSYANQYTKPFNEISSVVTELQNALACVGRVFELLEEDSVPEDQAGSVELKQVKGDITFEHVDFSYSQEKELITDLNLDIKAGMRVAIVGPTGCGKTTLINLLMRFYDPQRGAVSIDGVSSQNIARKSLRQSFGMVLQETWLKSGTVFENIVMGKPDATMDQVISAAKKAHSHSFIKRLEKGYDTVIGEDGGSLSQGQKQLLCITRLMLCQPPMLILDEATSSIDTRTEIKIQKAFNTLMKGKTTFIVAHRLSTIREADLILVMKDGSIIEQGNHEELLRQGGFYQELYQSQFPKNETA